jgi:hypothetical protein
MIENNRFPEIAQAIFNSNNDQNIYKDFMHESMKGKATSYDLHNKILQKFDNILTTNFDMSFEDCHVDRIEAMNSEGIPVENIYMHLIYVPALRILDINQHPKCLAYLHGNIALDYYIFKEEDYLNNYPTIYDKDSATSDLEDFLISIFKKLNLIFIGFSFSDKCFVELYRKSIINKNTDILRAKSYNPNYKTEDLPKHFIFIPEWEMEKVIKDNERLNFNNDKIWNILFVKTKDGYIPENNFRNDLNNLSLDSDMNNRLKSIYFNYKQNMQRIQLFDDINFNDNINIIQVKEYNHVQIILDHLTSEKRAQLRLEGIK